MKSQDFVRLGAMSKNVVMGWAVPPGTMVLPDAIMNAADKELLDFAERELTRRLLAARLKS